MFFDDGGVRRPKKIGFAGDISICLGFKSDSRRDYLFSLQQ